MVLCALLAATFISRPNPLTDVSDARHTLQTSRAVKLASGAVLLSQDDGWISWKNATPPAPVPFPLSSDLLGFEYIPGANANYGDADTWYPTWAADGNLYSPWTDGTVDGILSRSEGDGPGYTSTTGFATIIGDDPFNLNITNVGTFVSTSYPYRGRYPCGSVAVGDTWYYATYYLTNPNTTYPSGEDSGPNPGPDCDNWCVQGPMVGFRSSKDQGRTWTEPRFNGTTATDNVFRETAMHNSKVKFGAPHFVDFGRNLEHSPDGKAYIVGHGATDPDNVQAWMLGDHIYLARVDANREDLNDGMSWEFYDGNGGWVTGDVTKAHPILSWPRHMGVVTMTYFLAIRKYVMAVSTAANYPMMNQEFDTYFLEADHMTGPFRFVNYMNRFGPQAYFVNFPSKFAAAGVSVDEVNGQAYFENFLSYSANWAFKQSPVRDPPNSGYWWNLQHSRFILSSSFAKRLTDTSN